MPFLFGLSSPCPNPVEKLGHTVDLVVVFSVGKGEQFMFERLEPWCIGRNEKVALFELRGLRSQTRFLVNQGLVALQGTVRLKFWAYFNRPVVAANHRYSAPFVGSPESQFQPD